MRNALVAVLFGTLCAALPAQNSSIPRPAGDRYAYSIQYVPKNDFYKATIGFSKKRIESYDSISRYLQERLSREIEARGFHLAGAADSAAFKFTIDLMKVSDNQGIGNQFNPGNVGPIVTVQAAISITDSAGTLIYRKEYVGKAKLATPGGRERVVTMAGRAADDLVLKLDNDKDFKKVLYVPGGVMASSPAAPASQEAVPAQVAESAQAAVPMPSVPPSQVTTAPAQPRLIQLPAGTAVLLTLDQDFDPDRANEGDIISFTLADDLRVGAVTVASAGVKAKGSFYREALSKGKRLFFGGAGGGVTSSMPAGDPHIRMGYLEIGDLRVNLRSEQAVSKNQSLVPGAEILGSVRKKSGRRGWYFLVDKGTRFQAYTAENVNLPIVVPAAQSDQQTETVPGRTAGAVTAKRGDVFVVKDRRDLNFLRIAEGAKMSNATLPSGKVVPAPPAGMVWRVRKGTIVLEQDK